MVDGWISKGYANYNTKSKLPLFKFIGHLQAKRAMKLRPLMPLLLFVPGYAFLASSHSKRNHYRKEIQQVESPKYSCADRSAREFTFLLESKKASVQISTPELPTEISPTSLLDYLLSLLTSDLSSIILGSVGILLALSNRLSSIDYEASSIALNEAADMGMQSRMDLLAVFSAGAILLNGVSKLDVTSALADTVVLEGKCTDGIIYLDKKLEGKETLKWAMKAVTKSSPAKSVAVLGYSNEELKWKICALNGIIPADEKYWKEIPHDVSTPILNRFLKEGQGNKETYLPTLQALPGRSELTYLPSNTQEVLMLPINVSGRYEKAALVLGSDTAKTFSPKDVAWCQVLASRVRKSF